MHSIHKGVCFSYKQFSSNLEFKQRRDEEPSLLLLHPAFLSQLTSQPSSNSIQALFQVYLSDDLQGLYPREEMTLPSITTRS